MADTTSAFSSVSGLKPCRIVPDWKNRFFDFSSDCYEGEKLLFSNRQSEVENLFGVDGVYYKMNYSVCEDPLFKDDPTEHCTRMFKFKATIQDDLPTLEKRYALSGIYQDDVMKINCNKMHFRYFSIHDYSTSAKFTEMDPMVGDFIWLEYNNMMWRVIHMTDAADNTQYHEEQTNWQITIRKWVNNKVIIKPEEGTNIEDFRKLDEMIFTKDIFEDSKALKTKEEPKTIYKKRVMEQSPKNQVDNPFSNW